MFAEDTSVFTVDVLMQKINFGQVIGHDCWGVIFFHVRISVVDINDWGSSCGTVEIGIWWREVKRAFIDNGEIFF